MRKIISIVIIAISTAICLCQVTFLAGPTEPVHIKNATYEPIRAVDLLDIRPGPNMILRTNNGVYVLEYVKPPEPCKGTVEILKASAQSHIEAMRRDGSITNAISLLMSSGEVCKVAGHNWRSGRPGEEGLFFCDYHPGVQFRTCKICGQCQSQSTDYWK